MTVSVVIPTWNRTDLLSECLRSVAAQSRRPDEVIVVDDGSLEDVAATVTREYPSAVVDRLPHNRGFCVAANRGMRRAQGQYVFLLNNDMTLETDCLEQLLNSARPDTLLTPLVLFRDDPNRVYAAGDRVRVDGRPESIGFRMSRDTLRVPSHITGVTGGAALIPRAVLDRIGEFDERFVAYFEDADLALRARLAGFACAVIADAVALHVGSASLSGRTWWRARQCYRNHALLVLKNFPFETLLRHAPVIFRERLHQMRMTLSAARAAFGVIRAVFVLLAASAELVGLLPHALRERRRIQRGRTIGPAEFEALLAPVDRAR